MPVPSPEKEESHEDFMKRCMGDKENADAFPDQKQRAAVCYRSWEDAKKKKDRRAMPAVPSWLRAGRAVSRPAAVDRNAGAGVIRGYNVAQLGIFKDARGEFTAQSLKEIAAMMNRVPEGVKSRFTHPTLSEDGLGKFLGRSRNARVEGESVKADLHLSPSSRKTPSGDLGDYVMTLAEEDPGAFGSSLVLQPGRYVKDRRGELVKLDAEDPGDPDDPPLWLPEVIHASDVVDEGDAVHSGFLGVPRELAVTLLRGDLPDDFVRHLTTLMDSVFAGQAREVVEARVSAWLGRYLELRHGPARPTPRLDARKARLAALAKALDRGG